jgi:hypothetical protein
MGKHNQKVPEDATGNAKTRFKNSTVNQSNEKCSRQRLKVDMKIHPTRQMDFHQVVASD